MDRGSVLFLLKSTRFPWFLLCLGSGQSLSHRLLYKPDNRCVVRELCEGVALMGEVCREQRAKVGTQCGVLGKGVGLHRLSGSPESRGRWRFSFVWDNCVKLKSMKRSLTCCVCVQMDLFIYTDRGLQSKLIIPLSCSPSLYPISPSTCSFYFYLGDSVGMEHWSILLQMDCRKSEVIQTLVWFISQWNAGSLFLSANLYISKKDIWTPSLRVVVCSPHCCLSTFSSCLTLRGLWTSPHPASRCPQTFLQTQSSHQRLVGSLQVSNQPLVPPGQVTPVLSCSWFIYWLLVPEQNLSIEINLTSLLLCASKLSGFLPVANRLLTFW